MALDWELGLHPTSQKERGECIMSPVQEKPTGPRTTTPDPTAPAGSENSLGEESVRDGRPATGDEVVEAMDEEAPGVTDPLDTE
jgi:hypothetical protein